MKRTNKLLALLLAVLMVVTVLPLSVSASDKADSASNGGTVIYDADDFIAIKDNPGGDYQLANDIDFTGKTFTTPYVVKEFYGTLDGNNHKIKNVTLSYAGGAEAQRFGLIGHLGSLNPVTNGGGFNENGTAPVVQNLTIEKMSIISTDTASSGGTQVLSVGFLAGAVGVMAQSACYVRTPVVSNVHIEESSLDVDNTKYFNGSYAYNSFLMASVAVGGIVGSTKSNIVIKDCSLDTETKIEISCKPEKSQSSFTVGGIIGNLGSKQGGSTVMRSVVDNCVNNASINVTSPNFSLSKGDNGLGGIVGSAIHTFVVTNCQNNGAITMDDNSELISHGAIVGYARMTETAHIIDCKSTYANMKIHGSTVTVTVIAYNCFVGENGTATIPYNKNGSKVDVPADKEGFINALNSGSVNTIYVLPKDAVIELGNVEGFAVTNVLNGILYGNGATVKGNFTNGGLYEKVGTTNSNKLSLICNLKLDVTVNVTADSGYYGALTGQMGAKTGVVVMDVDVDLNNSTANGSSFGGITGYSAAHHFIDCTVSGTITSKDAATNVSAFIAEDGNCSNTANNQNIVCNTVLLNCTNYADIDLEGTTARTAGGFIGYTGGSWGQSYINCVNYGAITAEADVAHKVGALFGNWSAGHISIVGCADYGNLGTYGTVTADDRSSLGVNNFKTADFEMVDGASVRIDEVTGIRFAAKLDMDFVAALEAKYGADAVSYGIIIAPKAIVDAAGEFTTAKLDALKVVNDAYANVTMYNDIVADKGAWFEGVKGQIAGSITGLEGLYAMNLIGRGYIKVVVDNDVVFELYADYYGGDIANNTRSVARVAANALGDYAEGSDEYKALSAILAAARIN